MKELICFTVGLVIGAVVMKKNHTIDELEKELEREKVRGRPSGGTENA